MVGEYGVRDDPANPGMAAQWMKDAYNFAVANNFQGLSYFNSGANSPDGTWVLTGDRLAAFDANLSNSKTPRSDDRARRRMAVDGASIGFRSGTKRP